MNKTATKNERGNPGSARAPSQAQPQANDQLAGLTVSVAQPAGSKGGQSILARCLFL